MREHAERVLFDARFNAGCRRFWRTIRGGERRQREEGVRRCGENWMTVFQSMPTLPRSIGALTKATHGGAERIERRVESGGRRQVAVKRTSTRCLQLRELDNGVRVGVRLQKMSTILKATATRRCHVTNQLTVCASVRRA